jgi:hypothetical protein
MGDYTKTGKKIGTCGDAYYATHKMLKDLEHTNDPEVNYYLNPANSCTFAFPFPQYDGCEVDGFSNFHDDERGHFVFSLPSEFESHHDKMHVHQHPRGAEGINIFFPCPYSADGKASSNLDQSVRKFSLYGQCYFNGKLHVSVKCVYCGKTNIFSYEEILEAVKIMGKESDRLRGLSTIQEYIKNGWAESYLKEAIYITTIATRMLETYTWIVEEYSTPVEQGTAIDGIEQVESDFFITGSYAHMNKNETLEEYEKEVYEVQNYTNSKTCIKSVVYCSSEKFRYIKNQLMNDLNGLIPNIEKLGGVCSDDERLDNIKNIWELDSLPELKEIFHRTKYTIGCLVVCKETKGGFIIDSQGYNYARYVGLVGPTFLSDFLNERLMERHELKCKKFFA